MTVMRYFYFLILLFNTACSFTPEYNRPESPAVPKLLVHQPIEQERKVGDVIKLPEANKAYCIIDQQDAVSLFSEDTRLAHLLQATKENNYDIRLSLVALKSAKSRHAETTANLFPNINVSTVRNRSDRSLALKPTTTYSSELGVSGYEVDIWGRLRSIDEAAREQIFSQQYVVDFTLIEALSETMIAYYDLSASYHLLALLESQATLIDKAKVHIENLIDFGKNTESDYSLWHIEHSQTRTDIISIKENIYQLYGRLFLLTGLPEFLEKREILIEAIPDWSELTIDKPIYSAALLLRPDVVFAEANIRQANGSIGAARAAFFPILNLGFTVGNSSDTFKESFKLLSDNWSLSTSLLGTIFDFGKNKARLQQAEMEQARSIVEYQQTLAQAYRDLQESLDSIALSKDSIESSLLNIQEFKTVLEKSKESQLLGYQSDYDILQLEINKLSYDLALLRSRRDLALSVVLLYRALGGRFVEECQG